MNIFASDNILYIITDESSTPHWLRRRIDWRRLLPAAKNISYLKPLQMSGNIMMPS